MKDFMNNFISEVYCDFLEDIESCETLCNLKSLRFNCGNIPDYSSQAIQRLYLLRYFPAYTTEYYRIYRSIEKSSFLDYYNVLSIGSGCCLDYYGLYFATDRNLERICYTGLDRVNWMYTDWYNHDEFHLIHADINDWDELDWNGYNIIMFPKSIGEFDSSVFQQLLNIIRGSEFKNDRICLVSSIREQNDDSDINRMVKIVNIFIKNHGFRCLNNPETYFHYPNNVGLAKFHPNYIYPDEILTFITNLSKECSTYKRKRRSCYTECSQLLDKL